MDILIKNNIIKKNKMIIDIGAFSTKILEVHYASKIVSVTSSKVFENKNLTYDGVINFDELAKKVNAETVGNGLNDVVISLPSQLSENKIITIKNKKESEIKKIIEKEYLSFGKVNPLTHVVDYAFLGKTEEQGDTIFYFLISAVTKTIANDIVNAFKKYNIKVKNMVSSVYSQICLSALFYDDYEYLNRLMIDVGRDTTRVVAFSDGIPVYTRVLNFGFNSYLNSIFSSDEKATKPDIINALTNIGEIKCDLKEKEEYFSNIDTETYYKIIKEVNKNAVRDLSRVIDLCSNNDVNINKIYITGYVIEGFLSNLKNEFNVEVEKIEFSAFDEKDGKNFLFSVGNNTLTKEFSNAVGLAISPML